MSTRLDETTTIGNVVRRYTVDTEITTEIWDIEYTAKIRARVWQIGRASKGWHVVDTRRCRREITWWIERDMYRVVAPDDPAPMHVHGPEKVEMHTPSRRSGKVGWMPFDHDPCRPSNVEETKATARNFHEGIQRRLDHYRFHEWPELFPVLATLRPYGEEVEATLKEVGEGILEIEEE